MRTTELTDKQSLALGFIQRYIAIHSVPPKLQEIADGIGIRSRGVAHRYVQALTDAGYLEIDSGKHRGIRLLKTNPHQAKSVLPLLGKIAAGKPIEAIPGEDEIDLSDFFGPHNFAVRVQGDSMIEAGIMDGDTVIIKFCETANDGDIVVALIDETETTLKRLKRSHKGRYIKLIPANKDMEPMVYWLDSSENISLWPRAIALLDMNAFFASVEQRDFPFLLGKPVAITNGMRGSCIITCSYEARAFGVHTGMRVREALKLCPHLIQRPTRPKVYAKVSTNIMRNLRTVCPDIEVFSVDEAFIDITPCLKLYGSPVDVAHRLKQSVYEASGLLCSLGLSGDKTTAKYAAKLNKPDGFTVVPPWQAKSFLQNVPVTELCGIAKGIGNFLAQHGVYNCGDMEKLPISVLSRRFGNLGRRIWYMCQGADPDPLHQDIAAPKSIGHGKVMPPNTRDRNVILTYLQHMSSKVGVRMRRYDFVARTFWVGLKTDHGWIGSKSRLMDFNNDQQEIFQLCKTVLNLHWQGEGIHQVQVTALDPQLTVMQMDLFSAGEGNKIQQKLNHALDNINARYGEMCIAPARLLNRSDMPNVIAPAWKPDGLRQTV